MKKQLSVLLALVMVFLLAVPAGLGLVLANNYNVKVIVNGKLVDFSGGYGQPYISDDERTMVPVRGTAEAYGCVVDWDEVQMQVQVTYENHYAIIPIGQPYVYTDSGTREMDTSAVIINDRTYIPIRFTMEAMGAEVGWIENKTLVTITNPNIMITDHDEDLIPENNPSLNNQPPSYQEEPISDNGSLTVLKKSIQAKGSWDGGMGYVYNMTSPSNSSIVCKLVYNPTEDRVYVMAAMLLNSSGTEYMAQQIHINGSNNVTTSYVLRIYSNGADIQSNGHLIKGMYGDPAGYTVDYTSGTSKDMGGSMILAHVIPYQTALAMECLGNYCNSNNLRISPGGLGFAVS